MDKMRM